MNKEKVFAWIESLEDMADQSDRYFVERTELYKENQAKDKEIERLNNNMQILQDDLDIIGKELGLEEGSCFEDVLDSIDRLNNIIKELEKLIDSYELGKYDYEIPVAILKDRIKELKEGKNE